MKLRRVRYEPSKEGLMKVLGDLEADIAEALWRLGPSSVKKIQVEVSKQREVAVTTVATVLDRLYEKGIVERELKKGRGVYYEYRPALTRRQFERSVIGGVLTSLLRTFGDSAISYMLESMELSEEKKAELRRYLERLKEPERRSDDGAP